MGNPERSLDRLMRPRSIAVVGASSDPSKTAGRPVRYLQKHGYGGLIMPVNPRFESIAGLPCYPDVASLPTEPDVGIVLVGPERAEAAVRDLARAGAAAAIVLAGGYAETGSDGNARQQALRAAAGGMRLLGPNTIGLVNLTQGIMLSASGVLELDQLARGRIAVVSQSGGLLGAMLSRANARGIGFSNLICTGNEVDLDVTDFIEWLIDDDATTVIALYLETIRNATRFRVAAQAAARAGKPIVVFKVGRSAAGAHSAVSHTGALAGEDRLYSALFRQVGAIRVTTFADLIDVPMALTAGRRLQGNRLAILTSTGGAATLVADSAGLLGFETPPPDAETARRLRALQPDTDAVLDRNPVDVTLAGLRPDIFQGAIDALLESPSFDAVVTIVGSSGLRQPELVAQPVVAAMRSTTKPTSKPLIVFVSPEAPEIVRRLNGAGVPTLTTPEGCGAVLDALRWVAPVPAEAVLFQPPQPSQPSSGIEFDAGPLNEAESKKLFAAFGVRGVRELVAATPEDAARVATEFGFPVVLKILSRHIPHKSDVGGVAVGIAPREVAQRCREMAEAVARHSGAPIEGFLVQEQVMGGVELILGLRHDPSLGAAILLGAGGITAELFDDVSLRLLPLTSADAHAMIRSLKSYPLLTGYRGRPLADVEALVEAILAFARMAVTLGTRLVEAEINPLFVLPAGVLAGDGLAVLR